MKISTLLVAGFGMLMLLITFLGGVAQLKVTTMQRLFGQVIEERIPETTTANQIKEGLGGIAIALRNMILISDTERVQKEAQKIVALHQRIDTLVLQLQSHVTDDNGRAIVARVTAARQVFDPLRAEVMEMALGGQVFEAKALLVDKLNPSQDAYFAALDDLLLDQANLLAESTDSTRQEARSVKWLVPVTVVVALVVALCTGCWTVRAITRPIHQAVTLSQAVAAGDLSQALDTSQRNELGQLFQALQGMQTGLAQVVTQVRDSAQNVSTASAEIAKGNSDLSNRTEDQASALQQTSSAMAALREAVEHNATSAKDASQLALQAARIADQGGQAVSNVVGTMQSISTSAQHIAAITGVIDSIAFQTNILALNAAVEAARAGEQGRGFAVVASEVRLLASRSAEAAREIKGLIQSSGTNIAQGTAFAERAGSTMEEVVGAIRQVAEAMQTLSTANITQSQGVVQICDATVQMDQMTQQNAALVEQMAAAASSLQFQAQDLVDTVAVFKLNTAPVQALVA